MRTVHNFSVRLATIRFFPRASPTYRWRVSAYEDLDAFKACHQLTLAVHRLAEKLEERDATLSGHLRSEEHTSELQSRLHLVCRLLLEKKKTSHGVQPIMSDDDASP